MVYLSPEFLFGKDREEIMLAGDAKCQKLFYLK